LRDVPVYAPGFAAIYCGDPRRDGQAELTWVAGYIPRWFTRLPTVTHPSANRAWRRLTHFVDATNDVTNEAEPPPEKKKQEI